MAKIKSHEKNLRMVQLAMIMAIMVVLQIFGAALVRVAITVPALVLIPLYIGSAAFGKKTGAILGGFFGVITLLLGVTGFDGCDFQVYHRLYDVINITVVSDKDTVGVYDMNSAIEVK